MRGRARILLLFIPFILMSALAQADTSTNNVTLPTGRQIKILGIGPIQFKTGPPALMFSYQTTLKINDVASLKEEAAVIWQKFRHDVENAKMTSGIISAHEEPTGMIVTHSQAYNFVYQKNANGEWQLTNP